MVAGMLALAMVVGAALMGTIVYGALRWTDRTRQLRGRLHGARVPWKPQVVDFGELEGLPAPVQRYFRNVLTEGQPMVTDVWMRHTGSFNMGETREQWKPFVSEQWVITRRPGFVWNARIKMMPGLSVRVHDAYVAGEGMLTAALFGLFTVVDLHDSKALAAGELMRFLAEAAWYPTALLPSQGVRWEEVDAGSARAILVDGMVAVLLLFTFNEHDVIETVCAQDRERIVGTRRVPTAWRGRFWNYREQDGMRVPGDGEVSWMPPEGEQPYWRGQIREMAYEFAK
jgi:hypothetical protein